MEDTRLTCQCLRAPQVVQNKLTKILTPQMLDAVINGVVIYMLSKMSHWFYGSWEGGPAAYAALILLLNVRAKTAKKQDQGAQTVSEETHFNQTQPTQAKQLVQAQTPDVMRLQDELTACKLEHAQLCAKANQMQQVINQQTQTNLQLLGEIKNKELQLLHQTAPTSQEAVANQPQSSSAQVLQAQSRMQEELNTCRLMLENQTKLHEKISVLEQNIRQLNQADTQLRCELQAKDMQILQKEQALVVNTGTIQLMLENQTKLQEKIGGLEQNIRQLLREAQEKDIQISQKAQVIVAKNNTIQEHEARIERQGRRIAKLSRMIEDKIPFPHHNCLCDTCVKR